jgi:hypothetical protein
MVMMQDALPGIKWLSRMIPLPQRARDLAIGCIVAFIMHLGKMSAAQAAGSIRSHARHRAQIGRFLARRFWSRNLLETMQHALIAMESLPGEWLFLLDQTYVGQQGQKTENTFSRANSKARPKKSKRRQQKHAKRSCHCFVCGLLLLPSGIRVPFFKSYYSSSYCKAKNIKYRRQTEIAGELIRELPVPAQVQVTVLGDTAFEAQTIREACAERGFRWIVPLNPERVLAGPKKQRPKVWTLAEELQTQRLRKIEVLPQQGAFVAQRRMARCRLGPKLKARTFYVHQEKRDVHNVGEVLLVFSTTKKPDAKQGLNVQKILMTNDASLTAFAVVERYQLRWQIELFFKELKSTLGFADYRFQKFDKVEHWVTLVLLTFMYLEWYRLEKLKRRDLSAEQRGWWQWQRSHGLSRAIRHETESNELSTLKKRLETPGGIRRLRQLLKESQPTEYRLAV